MIHEARRVVGHDDLQCGACGPTPMCVHVDGNSKLYRYKSAGASGNNQWERQPYHENTCIARKADVDAHVKTLSKIGKVRLLRDVNAHSKKCFRRIRKNDRLFSEMQECLQ